MVLATALFLALLAVAHAGDPDAVDRPLSLFREERPVDGYALFGLLALVGGLHLRTYYRLGRGREMFAPTASMVLLTVVALTPSSDGGHALAAFALLGLVFGWYALRLYRVASPALVVHLAVPHLLLVHLGSSYGVWQKSVVVYFLVTVNVDCLLATGRLRLPGPDDFTWGRRPKARRRYAPRVIWGRNDRPPP